MSRGTRRQRKRELDRRAPHHPAKCAVTAAGPLLGTCLRASLLGLTNVPWLGERDHWWSMAGVLLFSYLPQCGLQLASSQVCLKSGTLRVASSS